MIKRIPTGIKGFDALIEGGLPESSITLVCGTPGAGKSIFCAQVLYHNALKGKKCLYLNLEQNEGRLEAQMKQFGWNTDKAKKKLKVVAVDSSDSNMIEFVLDEIRKVNYDLIVVDSLDSISSSPMAPKEVNKMGMEKISESVIPTILDVPTMGRLKLKKIFSAIAKSKATALLTSEKIEGAMGISRDTISEFLCDGIIVMTVHAALDTRKIEIAKMRNTKHTLKPQTVGITSKGLVLE